MLTTTQQQEHKINLQGCPSISVFVSCEAHGFSTDKQAIKSILTRSDAHCLDRAQCIWEQVA